MLSANDLLIVGSTVAGIAVVAVAAGAIAQRLLAARSIAISLTVSSALTVIATLGGVVVISVEMFIAHKDLDVVLAVVAFAGVGGLAVAALLGLRVATASRLLLESVEEVGTNGRYRPPTVVLPAELAGLSAGLESAHRQLEQAQEHERTLEASRRELVAWVSHDLRAPLAGLRAMAEALEDGVVTGDEETATYHRQIRRETDRLSLMIDDLFELSRIHAGTLKLTRRLVGLGDLIGEAITSAEPLARANGVLLNGAASGRLPVLVDPAQVGRALANLLVNAIQHSPPGGTVEILGGVDDGMASVTVSDSCGGIPARYLERVFDVAFRGEPARTPGPGPGGGAGLGLSIARGIVEAHAGRIAVENIATGQQEQGCRFVIRLPLASSAQPGQQDADPAMVATITLDGRRQAPLAAPRRTRPARRRTLSGR
jgi:signal transduction histidine kinase